MLWHRHKWKVTGAVLMERTVRHSILGEMSSPITEVLQVCDCGMVRTITLDGHWTLEQLLPRPAQAEADKDFFRKLGVKI